MSDQQRPADEPVGREEASTGWGEPVTYRRGGGPGLLAWLVAAAVVLILAVGAGLGTAYLLAEMNTAPGPRAALPDPTRTPAPVRTQRPTATATGADTPSSSSPPSPTDDASSSPVVESTPRVHVVAAGESVSRIALEYGVTVEEIIELNELRNPNVIVPGQQLLIPPPP
ncbi:MAG TPA: LysM domain-containing protein [Candidatus Caenarcaniphilales bacterium]|nr:LysM domain-containing protein [Candidatus Caenarcaniphilales bacterium]